MFFLLILLIPFYFIRAYLRARRDSIRLQFGAIQEDSKVIAFFHPYCNAGGGGERVLWSAIQSLHHCHPNHCFVVFSDNYDVAPGNILQKARDTFQLDLNMPVHFVKLQSCCLLEAKWYPMFTLLGQSLGSMAVGVEALFKCPPDLLVDTMGASFIFPLFRFMGFAKICAYVHYPIISVDMIDVVADNVAAFNNREFIARNRLLTQLKLYYYRVFAWLYRLTGKCSHVVMVNSTWTKGHIMQIWDRTVKIVYPPCNTDNLEELNLRNKDPSLIISISQFRPEKNQQLQLESFAKLIELLRENNINIQPTLILIGSCRNTSDERRVEQLRQLACDLSIENQVQFKVNISYREMVALMEKSSIAIHTMRNEHFGISVVEFLAAGLLTVVHNSGGPKLDIIEENVTGFLASDCDQFSQTLYRLITLSESEAQSIRQRARNSVSSFSQQTFEQAFGETVSPIL